VKGRGYTYAVGIHLRGDQIQTGRGLVVLQSR